MNIKAQIKRLDEFAVKSASGLIELSIIVLVLVGGLATVASIMLVCVSFLQKDINSAMQFALLALGAFYICRGALNFTERLKDSN